MNDGLTIELHGMNYDLESCLRENPDCGLSVEDVEGIAAVVPGEADGPPWIWLIATTQPRWNRKWVVLSGWCDYTGWDCQSGAEIWGSGPTARAAVQSIMDEQRHRGWVGLTQQVVGSAPYGMETILPGGSE